MYCKNCGEKLPYRAKFCTKCGAAIDENTRAVLGSARGAAGVDGKDAVKALRYLPGALKSSLRAPKDGRIRSVLCAILSLLLLATSWLAATGETRAMLREFRQSSASVLAEAESIAEIVGVDLDWEAVYDCADKIADGKLTPGETFSVCRTASPVLRSLVDMVRQQFGKSLEGTGILFFCMYLYELVFLASIALGCATVVVRVMGRETKINWLFFAAQALLFLIFVAVCLFCRRDELRITLRPTVTAVLSVALALLTGPVRGAAEQGARHIGSGEGERRAA